MKGLLMVLVMISMLPARGVLADNTNSDEVDAPTDETSLEDASGEVDDSEGEASDAPRDLSGEVMTGAVDEDPSRATPQASPEPGEASGSLLPAPAPEGNPKAAGEPIRQNADSEVKGEGATQTKRARNVFIGNILYLVGDVGSWSSMAMQIAGMVSANDELYVAGFGMSIGFGVLRFSGLLTSGISATKLTRTTVADNFKWGYFIAGLVVGASRVASTEALTRTGNGSQEALIGIFVGSWILQDLFWILHCTSAARLTKRFRASVSRPSYAVAPTVDPVTGTYGFSLNVSF